MFKLWEGRCLSPSSCTIITTFKVRYNLNVTYKRAKINMSDLLNIEYMHNTTNRTTIDEKLGSILSYLSNYLMSTHQSTLPGIIQLPCCTFQLSIHPTIHLSVYLSTYLPIYLSIQFFNYLSIYLSIFLSISNYNKIYMYL